MSFSDSILVNYSYLADGSKASSLKASGEGLVYRDHFTGQEDQMSDFGIPYSDHGARHYSPALRRWMTPDPLSEKYYGLSPYNYCHNNPTCRIDCDGMADYFSEKGEFLYNDSNDDGIMRIIASVTFNELKSISGDGESKILLNKMLVENSRSFKDQSLFMDSSAILEVFKYYNETGVPLVSEDFDGGNLRANNRGANNSLQISVNIKKNLSGPMLDSSYNIKNALNGHEKNHIDGMREGITKYLETSKEQREINAINAQMKHLTWERTTSAYKKSIEFYLEQQKK